MICPRCQGDVCRRSKRRNLLEVFVGTTGLRPWRCRKCYTRFFAWAVPLAYQMYAHCEFCGNLNLQRISREYVTDGWFPWLHRALRFPAYRCDPCRHRFFSLRSYHRIQAVHSAFPSH